MRTPAEAPDPFALPPTPAKKPEAAPAPTPEKTFETGDWAPPGISIKPDPKPDGDGPAAADSCCGCGHSCRFTADQLAALDAWEC